MRRAFVISTAAYVLLSTSSAAAVPTHQVPPAAPKPTSSESSPGAPDPHPPAGGLGPDGRPVGGPALQSRGLVLPASTPPLPADLTAAAWTLVDLDSGAVLAARDPHGRYQPASILKTLAAVTLLPMLPGAHVVTVSANAANAEGSAVGIVAGGRYTVDQLFTGLLLMSGNDAAAALAEAAGGVGRTVAAMNRTALALGAYDTFVQTPSGLDGWQQLTSAYDMSLFLRAAVSQPRFVAYDRQAGGTLPAQKVGGRAYAPVPLANQSENFLTSVPGALVAKTGFTDAASHTYLCAASRGGRRLGVVFLRAQRWPLDQWQQAAALLDWGYALPRSTPPVGRLDSPTAPAAAASTRASSSASPASASPSAASALQAASSGRRNSSWRLPVVVGTLTAVTTVVGGAFVARTRRRDPHET